jgi:hypothetical protein
MLMDLYGQLLTDRQRRFVNLHYGEDMSFGEIARGHGVSRQAIHDAVKHAEQALEDYESKLGLLEKGLGPRPGTDGGTESEQKHSVSAEPPRSDPPVTGSVRSDLREVAGKLEEIHRTLSKSGGIIYNADGVTRELGRLAETLRRLASEE